MSDITICMPADPLASGSPRVNARLGGFMLGAVIVAALVLSPTARRVSDNFGLSRLAPESLSVLLAPRVVEVRADSAAALGSALSAANFHIERVRAGLADVPRVLVRAFPGDLVNLGSPDERKQIFIKAMLPLVLQVNEQIAADRARILDIRDRIAAGEDVMDDDHAWLAEIYAAYGVAEGNDDELLRRVDVVPVSLALGQAALESGWGTSRFAQEGRALFGQLGDPSGSVIKSQGVAYRSFDSLVEAVRSYARNLDTNTAYRQFRSTRAALRRSGGEGRPLEGLKLVGALALYSERGQDYLDDVRGLIRANKLQQFDQSRLVGTVPLDVQADSERPSHAA